MVIHNIENINNPSLKTLKNEINLLEEICDIKFDELEKFRKKFWKDC